MRRTILLTVASFFLLSCTGEGPHQRAIKNSDQATTLKATTEVPFAVVEVSEVVAKRISSDLRKREYSGFFKKTALPPVVIGVGDTLSISIVSADNGGFVDFASSSLNPISTASLPPQEVTSDGNVNVPPVGRLYARGKSVQNFENFVAEKLSAILVDPSVIVQLSNRKSARVTVLGEVGGPGAVSLSTTDTNLIDMITAAGGPRAKPEDLDITLTRNGRSASIALDHLYETPAHNIPALPGDVILVDKPYREVTVLGSFAESSTVRLEGQDVSLSEAIGQFGGLVRRRVQLKGVYVYRRTPKSTLAALGSDVSAFQEDIVPTVYRFDFRKPTAFFTADEFELADGDILYATQSELSEINDVISALSPIINAPRAYGAAVGID